MNHLTKQIAGYFLDIYDGENWTDVCLKDSLVGLDWQQATTQVDHVNTIAVLLYHINFYVNAVLDGLQGNPPAGRHKDSFSHPPIHCREDWQMLIDTTWKVAGAFASYIGNMTDAQLWQNFRDGKDGNCYRHIQGVLEHNYYHMGQIVLLKKIVQQSSIK